MTPRFLGDTFTHGEARQAAVRGKCLYRASAHRGTRLAPLSDVLGEYAAIGQQRRQAWWGKQQP